MREFLVQVKMVWTKPSMAMGVKCMNFKVATRLLKRYFHVIVISFLPVSEHKTPENKTMIDFPDCVFQSVYYFTEVLSNWYLPQESTHLSCCCITIVFWTQAPIWSLSWWTLGQPLDSRPVIRKTSYKTNNSFLSIMQMFGAAQGRARISFALLMKFILAFEKRQRCIVFPPRPKKQPRWGRNAWSGKVGVIHTSAHRYTPNDNWIFARKSCHLLTYRLFSSGTL